MNTDFLSSWTEQFNNLILFGLLLIAGVLGGRLVQRIRYLPRITGFILAGVLLGPDGLGALSAELLDNAGVFVDIALGFLLYQLGLLLDVRTVWGDRALLLSSVWESAASFALVFLTLLLLRISPLPAALTAVAGISVSPVVLLATVRELGAQGPMTQRALNLVALNHVLAFLAYAAVLPFLHYTEHPEIISMIIEPFHQLLGSALVAFLLFHLLMLARCWTGENRADHFFLSAGVIVLGVDVAKLLSLSGLLTLFSLGLMVRNLDRRSDPDTVDFGQAGEIFIIVLFVVVGAKLEIKEPGAVWWAALAFVAARFAGKWLAVLAISKQFGLPALQAQSLGLTLLPMAGMAIGLAHTVSQMYPGAGQTFSAIVLAAVAIVETISPSVTEYALKRMGEAA